jgi:phospholipid/cholesterol/gamma-HCH transport system substrate-binding protein
MIVKRPSLGALIALVAFVMACFGMTIYMWIAFGGPIPLKPESYRMKVAFDDAGGMVRDTDIRIAGVNVGSVKSVQLDQETNQTVAELEIEDKFAPRPADTHVILRQKSLLGEPYIELSAGSKDGPMVPEGGTLPPGQVEESVSFDDLLSTFDPATRKALTSFLTDQGVAFNDTSAFISDWASTLQPFAINIGDALRIVRQQGDATASLISNGAGALTALSERQGQLQGLVENSSRMFRALGARNAQLADAIRILPTFIDEAKSTSLRLATFSDDTTPLLKQLTPAAAELSPALQDLHTFAPDLRRLMVGIKPLTRASKQGVPGFNQFLNQLTPFLDRSRPWLGELVPVINYATDYKRDLTGAIANVAAATEAVAKPVTGGTALHYARSALPISLESLGAFPQRFGTSRSNPYLAPNRALDVTGGLPQFGDYLCVNRPVPTKSPAWPTDIYDNVLDYYLTDDPKNPNPVNPPSPACSVQGLLGQLLNAGTGLFPQLGVLP